MEHKGRWAGIPASGRSINVPTCCLFHFDDARLLSESVYFDHATLLAQISGR
jgi:predicted ester cyclase